MNPVSPALSDKKGAHNQPKPIPKFHAGIREGRLMKDCDKDWKVDAVLVKISVVFDESSDKSKAERVCQFLVKDQIFSRLFLAKKLELQEENNFSTTKNWKNLSWYLSWLEKQNLPESSEKFGFWHGIRKMKGKK